MAALIFIDKDGEERLLMKDLTAPDAIRNKVRVKMRMLLKKAVETSKDKNKALDKLSGITTKAITDPTDKAAALAIKMWAATIIELHELHETDMANDEFNALLNRGLCDNLDIEDHKAAEPEPESKPKSKPKAEPKPKREKTVINGVEFWLSPVAKPAAAAKPEATATKYKCSICKAHVGHTAARCPDNPKNKAT